MAWTSDIWRERGLRAAILAGDGQAWRTLYDVHKDGLYTYVYVRVGRNVHAAEEITQETWLTALRRIRSFDPERGRFHDWLRGIAASLIANEQRRWARRRRLAEANMPIPDAVVPALANEAAETVALAFTALPPHYQAVLRAKYEEQRAVADIAESLGQTSKAVESLLGRARTVFREAYRRIAGGETKCEAPNGKENF